MPSPSKRFFQHLTAALLSVWLATSALALAHPHLDHTFHECVTCRVAHGTPAVTTRPCQAEPPRLSFCLVAVSAESEPACRTSRRPAVRGPPRMA